jgi:hypothetical protein
VERMRTTPVLGPIINVFDTYPRISAWVVLSIGIVGLLVYEARDVGLTTGNWIALVVASIIVAGLCVWIVSWEDEEVVEETTVRVKSEKADNGTVVYEEVPPTTSDDNPTQ